MVDDPSGQLFDFHSFPFVKLPAYSTFGKIQSMMMTDTYKVLLEYRGNGGNFSDAWSEGDTFSFGETKWRGFSSRDIVLDKRYICTSWLPWGHNKPIEKTKFQKIKTNMEPDRSNFPLFHQSDYNFDFDSSLAGHDRPKPPVHSMPVRTVSYIIPYVASASDFKLT